MKKKKHSKADMICNDYPDVIEVEEEAHRVVVVSDLHLSGGQICKNGKYRATENFFYDDEFGNFLSYLQKVKRKKPWKLIINGDFIDFIRLKEYPRGDEGDEYDHWLSILKDVGIDMKIGDLDVSDLVAQHINTAILSSTCRVVDCRSDSRHRFAYLPQFRQVICNLYCARLFA